MQIRSPKILGSLASNWLSGVDLLIEERSPLELWEASVVDHDLQPTLLPLSIIPPGIQNDNVIIAGLSKRSTQSVEIHGDQWENGRLFWLPEDSVVCDMTDTHSNRFGQLGIPTGTKDSSTHQIQPWWEKSEREIRSIHPSELTPEAGIGVLALICHPKDLTCREWALQHHHPETARLTNLERKFIIDSGYLGHYNVHVRLDDRQRYTMFFSGEKHHGACIQDTWVSLEKNALKKIKSQP